MNRFMYSGALGLVAAALAFAQSGNVSNAQSAMFKNTAAGTFVIVGSQVYQYDPITAATYFSNALTSGPVVTCAGNATNCAVANQPTTAPATPSPDSQKLTPVVSNNSCNFWDGSSLAVGPAQGSYTQSVTVNGNNGSGNWKYTWAYAIEVSGINPPLAQTAWNLQSSSTTNAQVTVTGFFAGQSTHLASGKGNKDWSFKTSHTMSDSLGAPRLVTPRATITDSNANVVCVLDLATTVEKGVDYLYTGNAGSNGNAGQLINDELVSEIQLGTKASPLGYIDNFSGNNATLGERATITSTTPAACDIPSAGTYTLNVTGTLKGVSGTASTPVGVTQNLCISAGTCSVCQPQ